ncbi:MAG TPA: methyltransferase, partial [Acidobacteriota bacterium]|nr:methyltransferase [Acidobacteriota bacterium]
MRRTAGVSLLAVPVIFALAFGQAAAPSPQSIDDRVREFLAAQKGQWRQENVTETDGRLLYDLILKRGYTRALEIGTSTG